MRIALVAGIVAAAVASGSALATGSPTRPAPPHPAGPHGPAARPPAPPPHRPAPARQHGSPPSHAAMHRMVAAWSAAHPGWPNPAGMTHAQLLHAALAHPAVYAPDLNRTSEALRLIQQYGPWATMSPKLRALERAQGVPIPRGIPYVPPSAYAGGP